MKIEMKKTIRNLTARARIVKTQAPIVKTLIAQIRRRKMERRSNFDLCRCIYNIINT